MALNGLVTAIKEIYHTILPKNGPIEQLRTSTQTAHILCPLQKRTDGSQKIKTYLTYSFILWIECRKILVSARIEKINIVIYLRK